MVMTDATSASVTRASLIASVIICTRDRSSSLARTLSSLVTASVGIREDWELLVVNNGSSDDTDQVIKCFAERLPVREVVEPNAGLSNARNAGVRESRGKFVLWTDDDVLVDEMWLQNWFCAFSKHPDTAVFGGRSIPKYETPTQDWFRKQEDELRYLLALRYSPEEIVIAEPFLPFGLNYAIRGTEQRAHLYNPELGVAPGRRRGGEETDVIKRILREGGTGRWVWEAIVYHLISPERQTEKYIQRFYTSAGYYNPLKANPPGRFLSRFGLYVALRTYIRESISYRLKRNKDRAEAVPALILRSRAQGSLRHYLGLELD